MAVNSEDKSIKKSPFQFGWIIPIFLRPRKTTAEIVERDKQVWLTPLLILSVLVIIVALVSAPLRLQAIQNGTNLPVDFQYYSEEQQQQFYEAQATQTSPLFIYVFPILSGLLKVWVSWFLLSILWYLSLTLAGSRAGSTKFYNLAGWSFMPLALRYLVQIIGILVTKELITSPGLSGFISADAAGLAVYFGAFLALIDIYFIFQVVLLFIGVIPLSGLTKTKAWIATAITLVIVMLLMALPGFLSNALSGLSVTRPFFF